jgi:hypothetical protein
VDNTALKEIELKTPCRLSVSHAKDARPAFPSQGAPHDLDG